MARWFRALLTGRRWQLSAVLMVTLYVAFLDRINITFALPLMAEEFAWNDRETARYGSLLMGLFYGAYGVANLLLTPLAARWGPRRSLLLIICLWSVFTAMGAWLSQWLMLLMASRVLLGLSEGVHVPMMTLLIKRWFPLGERSRANSMIVSGIFLAVLSAPLLLVPLMNVAGWRGGFLVLAVAGLLLSLPLVYRFVYDEPALHPAIDGVERAQLAAARSVECGDEADARPWWRSLLRLDFLLLTLAGVINNLVALGISSWLPTYFSRRWGVPYAELSWLVATPYLLSLVGLLTWARLGDRLGRRTLLAALGFAMAALLLYVALEAASLAVALICFAAGVFAITSYNACEFALVQRVLPLAVFAPCMGIYNGLTTLLGGGFGPWLVSPVIAADGASVLLAGVALFNGALLFMLSHRLRY